jgi:hypothetical protein
MVEASGFEGAGEENIAGFPVFAARGRCKGSAGRWGKDCMWRLSADNETVEIARFADSRVFFG